MATYVLSDVHGHLAALDRALSMASPASEDVLYVLGDMIDRGPDPMGVVRLVRSLANARVLMGNHEDLMLDAIHNPDSDLSWFNWSQNGAATTAEGLESLPPETYLSVIEWVERLPLYEVVSVGDQDYVLSHAGIRPAVVRAMAAEREGLWDAVSLEAMMSAQDRDDLLWIREEFWGVPTGLKDAEGYGPVAVAGHTPTPYVVNLANEVAEPLLDDDGHALMLDVGACAETGDVPDRLATDCAAAAGAGLGQVGIVRLDDHRIWYAAIHEGE
jgi:serine/threonine protein phosphatase 1